MSEFDIVIVGGGIAGASLGAEIAASRRTLILEAEQHCGYHSTGRSAAFWLESYGGPQVALLTAASRAFLDLPPADFAERSFLRTRGALHLSRDGQADLPPGVESREVDRAELERMLPGVRPEWRHGLLEPGCADIDVAALHAAYLRHFRRLGGVIATESPLVRGEWRDGGWTIALGTGGAVSAGILVNAAGAWADGVAEACGVRRLGIAPKRRTMVQLCVGRSGLRDLPLVDDADGTFYFKGEGDSSIWLSPHDEIATDPCDAAPEEIDVATAIDRFEQVVDWPVERVERSWAGLRSFAPDRLPVYGYDSRARGFFWCAGQGGFGIQTAPAAASLAAAVLKDDQPDDMVAHVDPAIFSPERFE
ncbi:MAG: NAD(P)/FAD-dependent oxidoreductase [Microvirga sp.]